MAMEVQAFKILPPSEQLKRVRWLGVPLGKRQSKRYVIYLYAVFGFYAELYYGKQSGAYECVRAFEDTEKLSAYLVQINLDELLANL